jgi:hypothetical protein
MTRYTALVLSAFGVFGPVAQAQLPPNVPYDGRPVIARLRFPVVGEPAACRDPDGAGDGAWSHDYPMSVQGMMKAVTSLTSLEGPVDSFVTIAVTDVDFMKYPFVMATETGCWNPTDREVTILRDYLLKGGLLFLDDLVFSWGKPAELELAVSRVETWLKRVLPEGKPMPIHASAPIFDGFFKVDPKDVPGYGATSKGGAELYGVYRDNDPTKSLMVIATYRGLLGHHWRHISGLGSGLGAGESPSGKAYRLGLNIFVYGLSH